MKRANIKDYNQSYDNFVIIENMIDLYDFFHEKTEGLMKDSARKLVDKAEGREIDDTSNVDTIVRGVEIISEIKKQGIVYSNAYLMGSYQANLEKAINDGKIIAVNPYNMVSYFTLTSDATYEIISEKENYTEDDIRLIRFSDGYHWYAKIASIDVVIDGEQKWNAKWVAKEKAKEFLKTL